MSDELTNCKAEIDQLKEEVAYWQKAEAQACDKLLKVCNEVTRLKTEVERLRKAGDAMAKAIRWLPQSISDHHLDAWNAAKEGKQS